MFLKKGLNFSCTQCFISTLLVPWFSAVGQLVGVGWSGNPKACTWRMLDASMGLLVAKVLGIKVNLEGPSLWVCLRCLGMC